MPLHPVPIILGTTLAVIGGGYAFKKFVYDPHMAPFIEALIASAQENHRQRHAVSVPATSPRTPTQDIGTSSSRLDRGKELRRRRKSSNETVHSRDGNPFRDPHDLVDIDPWGRSSAYELKESVLQRSMMVPGPSTYLDENTQRRTPMKSKNSDTGSPHLIALDSPKVLFDAPTPSPQTISPDSPTVRSTSPALIDASTISLLTLSPSTEAEPVELPHRMEDDVQSLSEAITSDYEDAEAYSPVSSQIMPQHPTSLASALESEAVLRDNQPRRRGPMSVVSISESEGWAGDSDWTMEGSEAGP